MDISNFSTANLMLNVVFSAIGMAYFIYGKKQHAFVPLVIGILLMGFPYFVSNTWAVVIIGLILTIAPFIARRIGL